MFAGRILHWLGAEDAGLSRPKAQAFTDETSQDISAEQLTLADADWIFYGVQVVPTRKSPGWTYGRR
ncbi:hypothetical protein QP157_21330 [Sphingomonas sp. LR61]|uniref:hypothetical protein n=1 Tax=Sphingomonas sp. LR61 TaxID=3050234 RepID=UPI002FE1B9F8